MFAFHDCEPVDLRPGDQLCIEDEIRRGDLIWFVRTGEHSVALRRATDETLAREDVAVYRIDRDPESGGIILRDGRAGGEIDGIPEEVLDSYAPFFRDTMLSDEVIAQYTVGLEVREPTFCDASYRFGGFVAPHRYVIFSQAARCLDQYSANPQWGLCVWPTDRHFRVIDVCAGEGRMQIALLDVEEGFAATCTPEQAEALRRLLAGWARELFREALEAAPLADLDTDAWRDRLVYPIGIDPKGRPYAP